MTTRKTPNFALQSKPNRVYGFAGIMAAAANLVSAEGLPT